MVAWCCLGLGAELQPEVASEIDFFLNICLLHTRKCQFNQGQSSIRCRRVMSRYKGKWRRERELVHVYGKLRREVMSSQLWRQVQGNHSHTGWYCYQARNCGPGHAVRVTGETVCRCACQEWPQKAYICTYLHISDMTMDVLCSVRTGPRKLPHMSVWKNTQNWPSNPLFWTGLSYTWCVTVTFVTPPKRQEAAWGHTKCVSKLWSSMLPKTESIMFQVCCLDTCYILEILN